MLLYLLLLLHRGCCNCTKCGLLVRIDSFILITFTYYFITCTFGRTDIVLMLGIFLKGNVVTTTSVHLDCACILCRSSLNKPNFCHSDTVMLLFHMQARSYVQEQVGSCK